MDTIPDLVRAAIAQGRGGVALHHPGEGGWVARTWEELAQKRRALSRALLARGVERGDRVAICARTRWEWSLLDTATLTIGGVVVGVYTSMTREQARYVLEHAAPKLLVVEAERASALEGLVDDTLVIEDDFAALLDEGARLDAEDPSVVDAAWDAVAPDDLATIVYTSGTTGPPKGAELTQRALARIGRGTAEVLGLGGDDVAVGFLPLAHVLTRVGAYTALYAGMTTWLAAAPERAGEAFQAAQPTALVAVPRVFEKVHATVLARVSALPAHRRKLFEAAMRVGHEVARAEREGRGLSTSLRIKHRFLDRIVLAKLRAATFGARARRLNSGGAPIARELLEFFHAMGVLVLEGYGLTETSSPCTLNRPGAYRFGTVGRPLPGCEVKIDDDGEILVKGPWLFRGYYQDPEATAAAFTDDGWFKTGDLGSLDEDGFLSITGRKKELLVTAQGKNVAPAPIENQLKEHPLISQAVLVGDRRPFIAALITVDAELAPLWAERSGAPLTPATIERAVQGRVDEVNAGLARHEQIKRFCVLDDDLSIEAGTLTPSLKVRRPAVLARYASEIDALFS